MRIVQLLPELNEGGVERGAVELNREFVKRGVDSIVISAGGKQAAQIESDGGRHVTFDVVSKNPLTAASRVFGLRKLLKQLQPDIIHARSRVPAWLAYLANKKLQIPFVTTVHGFNSVNCYSRIMTSGDRVICVSEAIRGFVVENYSVPDNNITVIPRGVDLSAFDPNSLDVGFIEKFSSQYKLEDRFVVSAVGRITQLKDLETFIHAIDLLRLEMPDVLGLIVGGVHKDRIAYFNGLQKLVTDSGLEEHICFAGSHKEVAEIYSLSQVVVSSSKKPESFGRSAAEALAMNTPVVASQHGGILDIVIEGKTGCLFPPGDAHGLKERIKTAAETDWNGLREFVVTHFSLDQMVDKTLDVYLELARGARK